MSRKRKDRPALAHQRTGRGVAGLLWFAVAGALGLAGLVLLPGRGAGDDLDHRTGLPKRTPAIVLDEARASGDARAALDLLQTYDRDAGGGELRGPLALLREELQARTPPQDASHPLQTRLAEAFTQDGLIAALCAIEDDDRVAANTERFFAPSADRPVVPGEPQPPDAHAARLLLHTQNGAQLDLGALLGAAATFSAAGRTRARNRWLLRAFAAHADDERLRLLLAQTYCKDGRYREAFVVTGSGRHRPAEDAPFWALRAQLAGWLGQRAAEADALEKLLQSAPADSERRLRIIELYGALGRAGDASRHAAILAERTRAIVDREQAVVAALDAGDAPAAIAHLQTLIDAGHDVRRNRERIVDIARLDLDYPLAIATLRQLAADAGPDEGDEYAHQLELLYRRCDRTGDLADLLLQRFAQQTADVDLGLELLHMLVGLGRRQEAERVLAQMQAAQARPVTFFRQLGQIAATSALQRDGSVEVRAAELATSPALTADDLPAVLEGLRPLARQRRFRPALETLAKRFAQHPRMQSFLLELVEAETDVESSARTAEEVARLTNEATLVREWAKRASWVGLVASERTARTRLAELNPDDLDNREALAWMLTAAGDHAGALPHWRALVEHGKRGSIADAYVAALLSGGKAEEALAFLRAQAARPDASLEERLQAADALLGANMTDAAAESYEHVLEVAPGHPLALLRLGQIRFWSHDPGGAVRLLTRRLTSLADGTHGDGDLALTHFTLAEALTALGRTSDARSHYEAALDLLRGAGDSPPELPARCLARLGRTGEAIVAYRAVVEAKPDDLDLRLDLADLLRGSGDDAGARAAIEAALARAPEHARAMRALADCDVRAGDYAAARHHLERSIELHGADADLYAELAHVTELAGDYTDALDAYRRWSALAADNRQALRGERDMDDRTRPLLGADARIARAGRDRSTLTQVHGAAQLGDRLRLSVHAGVGDYSGRSPAVGGNQVALDETVPIVGAQAAWRAWRRHEFAVGVEAYPGAPGDDLCVWSDVHLEASEPFASLDAHVVYGQLWAEPAAGAALGARKDGALLAGYRGLGDRAWTAVEAGLFRARADDPVNGGRVDDTLWQGQVAVGYRLTQDSVTAVADRFRRDRTPTGPAGPVAGAPAGSTGASTWLAWNTTHVQGNELTRVLPLGRRFDYALIAGRVDRVFAPTFGAMLDGYVGLELHSGDGTWSVGTAATWRPDARFEASLGMAVGDALARRGGGSTSASFFLQVHARW
ncbi:MAG: tetratricopeptide repeat protein [Planctomycetota bacterium]